MQIPEIRDYGRFNKYVYAIKPRFGVSIETLFRSRKCHFSKESIYSLGIQIIDILQMIHDAGYVYNDLRPDNLFLDYSVSQKDLMK